jgi:hypothetical protein
MKQKIGNFFKAIILFSLFLSSKQHANQYALQLKDHTGKNCNQVAVGEQFSIALTLQGELRDMIIEEPIPGTEQFTYSGTQTHSQFFFTGQKATRETTYSYTYRANQEGNYSFGPLTINLAGKTIQTEPIQLTVIKKSLDSNQAQDNKTVGLDFFAAIQPLKSSYYAGQEIPITLRIGSSLRRGEIKEIEQLRLPDLTVPGWEEKKRGEEELNGRLYSYVDVATTITPKKPGTLTLPEITITFTKPVQTRNNDPFNFFAAFMGNSYETVELQSKPVTLSINALPATSFPRGGIGTIDRITFTTDTQSVRQGEACIVRLTVFGKDAQGKLDAPPLTLPNSFKYYASRSETITGKTPEQNSRIFEYIIQGTKEGTFELPDQKIAFFDLRKQEYTLLTAAGFTLTITPGIANTHADSYTEIPEKKNIPGQLVKKSAYSIQTETLLLLMELFTYGTGILFALLLFIHSIRSKKIAAFFQRLQKKRSYDKAFQHAEKQITTNKPLLSIFKELFAQRLNCSEKEIGFDRLLKGLPEKAFTAQEQEAWENFIKDLFAQEFALKDNAKTLYSETIREQATTWIKRFEK